MGNCVACRAAARFFGFLAIATGDKQGGGVVPWNRNTPEIAPPSKSDRRMPTMKRIALITALLPLLLLTSTLASAEEGERPVQFARDVLPILSTNCFSCHGPDESHREADLRLDLEADAKRQLVDGAAVVEGDPAASLLIARITSSDPHEMMPPPEADRRLEPEQIETLRRWIAQGAHWETHWAFQPLVRPEGTLDDLIRAGLAERGLELQPAASPQRLARRLSLDLIGLPPTPEMADALAADPSPEAYERFVDDLLARPQFGEHWARMWLDLARYADTKGYEKDLGRTMWPYRDWVIDAFNDDMPLDQFTIEQLAGDLLPEPTPQQVIATGFHRNTMTNDEGGTDDEEFRVAAVKDRINTTVQVWMGLTMGCAQCHTHKYDPISIDDYYRFFAIFNQTEDADRSDDAPRMDVISPEQETKRKKLQQEVAGLKKALQSVQEKSPATDESGETLWSPIQVGEAQSEGGATLKVAEQGIIEVEGKSPEKDVYRLTFTLPAGRYTAIQLEALPAKLPGGKLGVGRNPSDTNFVVSEFILHNVDSDEPLKLTNPRATFSQNNWPVENAIDGKRDTGWAVSPQADRRQVAIFDLAEPLELEGETTLQLTLDQQYGNRLTLARFRVSMSTHDPEKLKVETESPQVVKAREQLAAAEKNLTELNNQIPKLPIMRELPEDRRRQTKIHNRGNFLDQGEPVEPAVLSGFHGLPESMPPTRLGVAHWLVSPENDLTPRVWANRIWARLFGRGLVETEEDFGTLGAPPTHPEVLDLLAAEYRENGWSLKKLLKTIVLSEAYRQSSQVAPSLAEADPANEWISRAPRYRLTGETIRDQALAVSGLLSDKMHGPSIMPPQPPGLWRSTYSGQQWIDAEGEDRFRRGLYTYLKRTTPYPSFTTFDGGSGEVCLIRRVRTNTPLQALITLNDPVMLEAAAALANRMLASGQEESARVDFGLRLALIRPIEAGEGKPLVRLLHDTTGRFQAEPDQAKKLIAACRGDAGELDPAEYAAWIVVASSILNLDEFLTRN